MCDNTIHVLIHGQGFNPFGSTINTDSDITATVNIGNSTFYQLDANFAVSANASSGNHAITVTVNSQTSNSVNFFVQVPTTLSVLSVTNLPDGTGSQSGCPSGSYGIKVIVKYQVVAQDTSSIQSDQMEPQETVTNTALNGIPQGDPVPSFSDIGPSRIIGTSQFTDTNGQFLDAPYGICGSDPFNSYTFTQTIQVLVVGTQNAYQLRTNNVTATGTSAGHGTISNSGDIQSSRP